jgi:hypothetical protein
MGSSKFIKTPKLGVVLQITEMAAGGTGAGRLWEIHDIERNRGFRVTLPLSTLAEPPSAGNTRDRPPAEREIEGAIGIAIERALLSPPEKISGSMYDVEIAARDLREFLSLGRA